MLVYDIAYVVITITNMIWDYVVTMFMYVIDYYHYYYYY